MEFKQHKNRDKSWLLVSEGGKLVSGRIAWSNTETLYLGSTNISKIKEDNENSNPISTSCLYLKLVSDVKKRKSIEISQHQYRKFTNI